MQQGTYKMSYSPECLFFLQPSTLATAVYNCLLFYILVATLLLVAVNKSLCKV